jgi:phosphatidylglycerol:prolipoprotein diacylglycerol transferase
MASGVLRLGPLRVSVYGLCAAVGLLAALWLSQETAKLVGVAGDVVWDAGWFAVAAAFVISRVLLVVRDLHAFETLPLLILALPSFTYLGMALTAVAMLGYLRWKRLPLVAVMDALAPCAALLALALSLGHYFEGTDAGMPTTLRWGPVVPGSGGLMHLQPVQLLACGVSMVLFMVLLRMLERGPRRGVTAGVGMVAGGAAAFGLEMLMQPTEVVGSGWLVGLLEPGQWIALGAMVVGAGMLLFVEERK